MSRQLLIMRHAKSAWNTDAPTDFKRPLSKRGKRDAPRMGMLLRTRGLIPAHVVSSPAARAKKTTFRVCNEVKITKAEVHWDQRIYMAGRGDLLTVLAEQPTDAHTILLVGHCPGVDELLSYLWGDKTQYPPDGNLMPTATIAHLEMPDNWSNLEYGCAKLMSLTRPRELTEADLGL